MSDSRFPTFIDDTDTGKPPMPGNNVPANPGAASAAPRPTQRRPRSRPDGTRPEL